MPLNETQFPGSPSTDLQGTIDNYCPSENQTQIQVYEYTNYNFLKIENPTKILTKFRLKNELIPWYKT